MKNGREREVTERVDDVEVAGYVVNEEVMNGEVEGWAGTNFDSPEQVKMGRKEELELMIKELDMFEFGTYEEAVSRGCKEPTTTKWVDRWKADDEGGRFVRCRLDGRDFKAKGVEEREVFFCGNATSGVEEVDVLDGWLRRGGSGGEGGSRR